MAMNYTLDNDLMAKEYLNRLIQAQKKGVQVFLFIDSLVSRPNRTSIRDFKAAGGCVLYRNKKQRILNSLNRSFFQRDHEKILLADNRVLLGSANISKLYGGKRFGQDFFMDLNILMENCGIKDTL